MSQSPSPKPASRAKTAKTKEASKAKAIGKANTGRAAAKSSAASSAKHHQGFFGRLRSELGLLAGIVTTVLFYTIGKEWIADLDNLPCSSSPSPGCSA